MVATVNVYRLCDCAYPRYICPKVNVRLKGTAACGGRATEPYLMFVSGNVELRTMTRLRTIIDFFQLRLSFDIASGPQMAAQREASVPSVQYLSPRYSTSKQGT